MRRIRWPTMSLVCLRPRFEAVCLSRGNTALLTDLDGTLDEGRERGLFVHQTRVLSRHRIRLGSRTPRPVGQSSISQHAWVAHYIAPAHAGARAMKDTIALQVARAVGEGLRERLILTNFSPRPVRFTLHLTIGADFAGLSETRTGRRQRGTLRREVHRAGSSLEILFDYRARHRYSHRGERGVAHLHRGLRLRVEHADSRAAVRGNTIDFEIALPPQGSWRASLAFVALIDGHPLPLPPEEAWASDSQKPPLAVEIRAPGSGTLGAVVAQAALSAQRDLRALRLTGAAARSPDWLPAAGAPTYLGLFGRDTLVTGLQSAWAGTTILSGALETLPRWQGKRQDPWRDEMPGRMVHQVQRAPLSELNYQPFGRYYGDLGTPPLYADALYAHWLWTGDEAQLRRSLGPALRAMRWLEGQARNPAGFYAFRTRSSQGLKNQSWKDSSDAIVYEDGTVVPDPIATSEIQGLVYDAYRHLATVLAWLGEPDGARAFATRAREIKARFNSKFWMEKERYFAFGLDARGRKIRSISSDPGVCLATGIVDESRAAAVVERLMKPDMFSGWGIRTLSAGHPAFNPYSYQRGSVWPVENAMHAIGFARYGHLAEGARLVRAQFEAAALFDYCRLPEVFSGHARSAETPFPVPYIDANWPQAWSCSAIFALLRSLLGLVPIAPLRVLLVDPHLPAWLPELTVRDVRVAGARCTLHFQRRPDGRTHYEVRRLRGKLRVVHFADPWQVVEQPWDELADRLASSTKAA